jgi:serine phosphatase RsbU (regulator of sigma subunit)
MTASDFISAEQFRQLLGVSRSLTVTTDLDALLNRIAEAATDLLACERASIFLHDAAAQQLWTTVALKAGRQIRVPVAAGIVGVSFRENKIINCSDAYKDLRFDPSSDQAGGFITRSLLAAPLSDISGKPLGILQAINKLQGEFSPRDEWLVQLLSDQAGVAIQRYRLQAAAVESIALRREIELARRVQDQMTPKSAPVIDHLGAAGRTRAASITGGDCFDFWKTPDGRLAVLLADASGHGLAPTLVVSQTRTLVRLLAQTSTDPDEILRKTNAQLFGDLETGRFVTAMLSLISPSGELTWASAGHGPAYVKTAPGAALQCFDPQSPPLAVESELPPSAQPPARIEPGGFFSIASDGLYEVFSPSGEEFGPQRLAALIGADHSPLSPDEIIDRVYSTVADWRRKPDPEDDQTMVFVEVR